MHRRAQIQSRSIERYWMCRDYRRSIQVRYHHTRWSKKIFDRDRDASWRCFISRPRLTFRFERKSPWSCSFIDLSTCLWSIENTDERNSWSRWLCEKMWRGYDHSHSHIEWRVWWWLIFTILIHKISVTINWFWNSIERRWDEVSLQAFDTEHIEF